MSEPHIFKAVCVMAKSTRDEALSHLFRALHLTEDINEMRAEISKAQDLLDKRVYYADLRMFAPDKKE